MKPEINPHEHEGITENRPQEGHYYRKGKHHGSRTGIFEAIITSKDIKPAGNSFQPIGKYREIFKRSQASGNKDAVMETFCRLSEIVGVNSMGWRYDPILIDQVWTVERHIEAFSYMASKLAGYTKTCVISFIDLYEKVKRNYPEARAVSPEDQRTITSAFVDIGNQHGMTIKPCGESNSLESLGADCTGCMTVRTFETAIGQNLKVPPNPNNRKECACYLTGDIGAYNTCGHFCRYCYANADKDIVRQNIRMHDPDSPFLIGNAMPGDVIHKAKQVSYRSRREGAI